MEEKTLKENERCVYEYTFPFIGIEKIKFLDAWFKVPKDYENYLKALYGENYLIPNSSWNIENDRNYIILKNKIGKYYNYRPIRH